MKVEIVSIGDKLLMSDILDTNTPFISHSLREVGVKLTCKVTVGDDLDLISDVIRVALGRADVVLTVGDPDSNISHDCLLAAAKVTGRPLLAGAKAVSGAVTLGGEKNYMAGFLVEEGDRVLICLPGKRRELSFLLENEVLPYLNRRLSKGKTSGWTLLRTVDIMESSLKQQLEELPLSPSHHVTYDSFGGQTDIRLWVEADSTEKIEAELADLKAKVAARLGDHIYGGGEDRLENVVYRALLKSGNRVAVAECGTEGVLIQALSGPDKDGALITGLPFASYSELAVYLELKEPAASHDLGEWCQKAAASLLAGTSVDLGLLVCKDITQGGMQIIVALASTNGVSVTQRSFGGHPENINQWAYTLALSHLRRWLLAHH